MKRIDAFCRRELDRLSSEGTLRSLEPLDSGCLPSVSAGGAALINLSSNNYLALNGHPRITAAMCGALGTWGTSSGASRLIAGDLRLFEEAEAALARFKGTESALVFPSGYQANVGIIATLAGENDAVFSDALNHASIIDGCRLGRSKVHVYRHGDMDHLEQLLRAADSRNRLIVTDGVFSMDGDRAPLREIVALAERYGAAVLVDDAHATGVIGARGRGTAEACGVSGADVMTLGTGGKALGVSGAFLCCSRAVREYLINRCRAFIYSTAPSPCVPAGLIEAAALVDDEAWRRDALRDLSRYFWERLRGAGYETSPTPSHILPLIIGDTAKAVGLAARLRDGGVFAKAIRTPTVPAGSERVRFSLTAAHTRDDVNRVMAILEKE